MTWNRQKQQLPSSQSEYHATNIDTLRFTESGIPGTTDSRPNNANQTTTLDQHRELQARSNAAPQSQEHGAGSHGPTVGVNHYTPSTTANSNAASDVMDTNLHTSNLEFYGSASSVAFLRHVETLSNTLTTGYLARPPVRSLASFLHNPDIQPETSRSMPAAPKEADPGHGRFYFREARRFLDAYFSNMHPIQPLFDEEEFLTRCEDLWFDRPDKQPLSFTALYYATLSLGSLVMTSDISGSKRFAWGHRLFNQALAIVTRLGTATDIEMTQCFYMVASYYRD
ncbi:hypothetical protein OHC33_006676 [Knufia fluminis]|uniref:Transcription factor domain-containing protein n=1 Tax=Knufia fluminis TaxID=191047 RepID=A0AAN8ECP6_9EURO|nr:hypothetical protein OHC33_006676 [Knufia fluminis]